jgi:hypothetical protein
MASPLVEVNPQPSEEINSFSFPTSAANTHSTNTTATPQSKKRTPSKHIRSKGPLGRCPEWSDMGILSEKWPNKIVFEDPDSTYALPSDLLSKIDFLKRPFEVLQQKGIVHDEENAQRKMPLSKRAFEWSNEVGEWSRSLVSSFLLVSDHQDQIKTENYLWNLIWPKTKDGKPAFSIGGILYSHSYLS